MCISVNFDLVIRILYDSDAMVEWLARSAHNPKVAGRILLAPGLAVCPLERHLTLIFHTSPRCQVGTGIKSTGESNLRQTGVLFRNCQFVSHVPKRQNKNKRICFEQVMKTIRKKYKKYVFSKKIRINTFKYL